MKRRKEMKHKERESYSLLYIYIYIWKFRAFFLNSKKKKDHKTTVLFYFFKQNKPKGINLNVKNHEANEKIQFAEKLMGVAMIDG